MSRALVNVPAKARKGDVVEIKVLVQHPMETGFRPGPDGRAVPGAPMSSELLERLAYHGFDPSLLHRSSGWWDQTRSRP